MNTKIADLGALTAAPGEKLSGDSQKPNTNIKIEVSTPYINK